jgi:hypothetical protein
MTKYKVSRTVVHSFYIEAVTPEIALRIAYEELNIPPAPKDGWDEFYELPPSEWSVYEVGPDDEIILRIPGGPVCVL